MEESRELLRQRFEAMTDIIVGQKPDDWQQYAKWLEKLALERLNNEIVMANEYLRKKMSKAIDILEKGISKT